jgi:CubicO group peptidase (beta-lactamase class C family)
MFINAWDMARFGYLFLANGKWRDTQVVSDQWIRLARTPGDANREYGYMNWFLNTGRKSLPSAPESSVTFRGNGANIIYIDWQHDLVVVVRWINNSALDPFLARVLRAVQPATGSQEARRSGDYRREEGTGGRRSQEGRAIRVRDRLNSLDWSHPPSAFALNSLPTRVVRRVP